MTSSNAPTSPRPPDPGASGAAAPEAKPKIDLSMSQTLGGALAAMTAAALGSRLGVGGTIIGAAVASIIAGVAGAFYTASLRTGRDKVKTVWTGRIAGTDTKAAVDVVPETPVWDAPEAAAETRVLPRTQGLPAQAALAAPSQGGPRQATAPRKLPWKGMLVGAFAVFAIAFVGLTAFELLSGSALSGGQGTTFQQVTKDERPAPEPASDETPESPSPSASESESETPTPTPTPSPSELPAETPAVPAPTTEGPTTGQEPSPTPSQTAETETPSSAPTPSAGGPQGETPAG